MPVPLPRSFRSRVLLLVVLGVVVRVAFLLAAGELDPYRDESSYVYVAGCWVRYGFYPDRIDFLWPPGYPAYLALFLRLFDVDGLFLARLAQCVLSASVGTSVAFLGRRIFDERAGLIATALWAVHLPLVGFTHFLWPETLFLALFLPGFVLLLGWNEGKPSVRTLLPAGLLLGVAALVKESALPVIVLLSAALLWRGRNRLESAVPATLAFLLAVLVVVLPWGLRNQGVYGHFSLLGATTGKNAYIGLNGHYRNFDVPPRRVYDGSELVWRRLIEPPANSHWERADTGNVFDRSAENMARGKAFVAEHPGYYARSRIKRVADWVTPLSFVTRHVQSELYGGLLGRPFVRAAVCLLAIATTVIVLAGALPGLFLASRPETRPFLIAAMVGTAGGIALVAISRYRVPVEPLLLVLAAGAASGAGRPWSWRSAWGVTTLLGLGVLGLLWAIQSQEVAWVLGEVLG